MQAVAVAIAKATWALGKREVRGGHGRGIGGGASVQAGEVETPARTAEARRETMLGAEGDEEGDECDSS